MISNFFPSILLEPTLQKLSFLVASVTQFLDFLFLDLLAVPDQEPVKPGLPRDDLKVIAQIISRGSLRQFDIGHVLPVVELQ